MDDKNSNPHQSTEELIAASQKIRERTRKLLEKCEADKARAAETVRKLQEEWDACRECENRPES